MAVYKLIQDIEAEDKLLGPLTLKGFIYALVAGLLAFVNFKLVVATELGKFRWVVILILAMPMLLAAVLASPLGREQPTEIWLLSRVRFFLKPRQRIWDQDEVNKLVTITAPPKNETSLTKTFSQIELKSRLKTLALTLDSRGWAVKNVNLNAPDPQILPGQQPTFDDRLVTAASMTQVVPVIDVNASDDILDGNSNKRAARLDGLMQERVEQRKVDIQNRLEEARSEVETAVMNQPSRQSASGATAPIAEGQISIRHQNTATAKQKRASNPKPATLDDPMTAAAKAAKLELAQSGSDLSVASIAKLANRQPRIKQVGPNEVVITLH